MEVDHLRGLPFDDGIKSLWRLGSVLLRMGAGRRQT